MSASVRALEDLPHPDVRPYDYLPRNATAERYTEIMRLAYDRRGSGPNRWWSEVFLHAQGARAAVRDGARYGRPWDPLVGVPEGSAS